MAESSNIAAPEVRWSDGALKRMERAHVLRGMVRRLAEKKARELGYAEITEEILEQLKGQMMGTMGGKAAWPRLPTNGQRSVAMDHCGRRSAWLRSRVYATGNDQADRR